MTNGSRVIYWIGGSPWSGKSTIAGRIADKYGFTYYKCDDFTSAHSEKCQADVHPTMHKIKQLLLKDNFSRPVEEQLADTVAFYREEFAMVLADITQMDTDKPILVEGAALLPELVHQHYGDRIRGVWVIPTKEFQLEHYAKRMWIHSILKDCDDPGQCFANWMVRDSRFAEFIKGEVHARGLDLIIVDGNTAVEDTQANIEEQFGLNTGE